MAEMKKDTTLTGGGGSESDFDESQHPRDSNGMFNTGGCDNVAMVKNNRLAAGCNIIDCSKLTTAEKIASVKLDLSRDNILPELSSDSIDKMGCKQNKKVLVKLNIIDRNAIRHSDINESDINKIIGETLYSPAEVFKGLNNKENYYTFAKPLRISPKNSTTTDNGVVLIDIDPTKEKFEVVHWQWASEKKITKMRQ